MNHVLTHLTRTAIAAAYSTDEAHISIIPYAVVNAIKITFPRTHISGSLADNDIYGCQMHTPLANIML